MLSREVIPSYSFHLQHPPPTRRLVNEVEGCSSGPSHSECAGQDKPKESDRAIETVGIRRDESRTTANLQSRTGRRDHCQD